MEGFMMRTDNNTEFGLAGWGLRSFKAGLVGLLLLIAGSGGGVFVSAVWGFRLAGPT